MNSGYQQITQNQYVTLKYNIYTIEYTYYIDIIDYIEKLTMIKPTIKIVRDSGHPWDGYSRTGKFDMMYIDCTSYLSLTEAIKDAESKFWAVWISSSDMDKDYDGMYSAVMYKPAGIKKPWSDNHKAPHPGMPV